MSAIDNELRRVGLDPAESPLSYLLLIRDGDEAWLTAVRKGVRVRVCKVPWGELMTLIEDGARIASAIAPR